MCRQVFEKENDDGSICQKILLNAHQHFFRVCIYHVVSYIFLDCDCCIHLYFMFKIVYSMYIHNIWYGCAERCLSRKMMMKIHLPKNKIINAQTFFGEVFKLFYHVLSPFCLNRRCCLHVSVMFKTVFNTIFQYFTASS